MINEIGRSIRNLKRPKHCSKITLRSKSPFDRHIGVYSFFFFIDHSQQYLIIPIIVHATRKKLALFQQTDRNKNMFINENMNEIRNVFKPII